MKKEKTDIGNSKKNEEKIARMYFIANRNECDEIHLCTLYFYFIDVLFR